MTTYPTKHNHAAVYSHAEAEPKPRICPYGLAGVLLMALSAGLMLGLLFIAVSKLLEML
jgi:hypothetical protein